MVCHKKRNNNFNNDISHQNHKENGTTNFKYWKEKKKKNTSNPELYMQQKYLSETDMK